MTNDGHQCVTALGCTCNQRVMFPEREYIDTQTRALNRSNDGVGSILGDPSAEDWN